MSNTVWLGKVGCCPHGVWFRENEWDNSNQCTYCAEEERRDPKLRELREIKELLKRTRR